MSLVAHLIVSWWAGDQPRYEVGGWTQATLQSHHQAGLDHLHRGTKSTLGQAHTTYSSQTFLLLLFLLLILLLPLPPSPPPPPPRTLIFITSSLCVST